MEQEHRRRPRYKGTHPRTFQEKYKEHDPEKYRADVEKIIESGKTPAGMHIPILVDEILEVLQIRPGQVGYDATLGYGGHTRRMLEQLQGQGHLYATDVDAAEMEKTRARLEKLGYGPELLTVRRMNFADADQVAPGVLFDFVLADLGVSSMQIDDPARGFTFKQDGPPGPAAGPVRRRHRGGAAAPALSGGAGRPADGKRRRALRRPHREGRHPGVPPGRHGGHHPPALRPHRGCPLLPPRR